MAALAPDDPLLTAACVVVIDACSTLDVIRIPVRPEWSADAESVEQTLAIAGDPSALLLATPAVIEAEFQKHRQGAADQVHNELRRHHNTLTAEANVMTDMLKRCGIAPVDLPVVDVPPKWAQALADRFVALGERVHVALTVLPHDHDDLVPAYSRVATSRAPAARVQLG